MRSGLDAATLNLYLSGEYDVHTRLSAQNGSGTYRNLFGRYTGGSLKLPDPNEPIGSLTVEFVRETTVDAETTSLAPTIVASTYNRLDDGVTYSPLLQLGRLVKLEVALTAPGGARPADNATIWYEIFRGTIANVSWPSFLSRKASIRVNGIGSILQHAKSEDHYVYTKGTSLETVFRQVLDNNGFASVPIHVPVATGKVLPNDYAPGRQKSVWSQLTDIAKSYGAVTYYRYRGQGEPELTLFTPAREKTTTDMTVDTWDYNQLEIDEEELRNVGHGVIFDEKGELRNVGPVVDNDSILKYGGFRRPFWIVLDINSPVRTEADMLNLLGQAVPDVSDPDAVGTVLSRPLVFLESGVDRYLFTSLDRFFDGDQNFAPFGSTFNFQADAEYHSLTSVRGVPTAGSKSWRHMGGTSIGPFGSINASLAENGAVTFAFSGNEKAKSFGYVYNKTGPVTTPTGLTIINEASGFVQIPVANLRVDKDEVAYITGFFFGGPNGTELVGRRTVAAVTKGGVILPIPLVEDWEDDLVGHAMVDFYDPQSRLTEFWFETETKANDPEITPWWQVLTAAPHLTSVDLHKKHDAYISFRYKFIGADGVAIPDYIVHRLKFDIGIIPNTEIVDLSIVEGEVFATIAGDTDQDSVKVRAYLDVKPDKPEITGVNGTLLNAQEGVVGPLPIGGTDPARTKLEPGESVWVGAVGYSELSAGGSVGEAVYKKITNDVLGPRHFSLLDHRFRFSGPEAFMFLELLAGSDITQMQVQYAYGPGSITTNVDYTVAIVGPQVAHTLGANLTGDPLLFPPDTVFGANTAVGGQKAVKLTAKDVNGLTVATYSFNPEDFATTGDVGGRVGIGPAGDPRQGAKIVFDETIFQFRASSGSEPIVDLLMATPRVGGLGINLLASPGMDGKIVRVAAGGTGYELADLDLVASLDDLTDVSTAGANDNDQLLYDAGTGTWGPGVSMFVPQHGLNDRNAHTGVLEAQYGGTGLDWGSPGTHTGSMIYYSSATSFASTGPGGEGQILKVISGVPQWANLVNQLPDPTGGAGGQMLQIIPGTPNAWDYSPLIWPRQQGGAGQTLVPGAGMNVVWGSLTAADVGAAAAGHDHAGVYEPVFAKNSAFNKNFGTTAGTVAEGNHTHTFSSFGTGTDVAGTLYVANGAGAINPIAPGGTGQVLTVGTVAGVYWTSIVPLPAPSASVGTFLRNTGSAWAESNWSIPAGASQLQVDDNAVLMATSTSGAGWVALTYDHLSGGFNDTVHGNRGGGTLHAEATGTVAGFMPASHFALVNTTTSANTGGAMVKRDASGNFSAGTITANLTGTASNATTLGGRAIHVNDVNNEANKVVRTNASGYIMAGWINTVSGDAGTNAITRVYASYDGYIRYYTLANFKAQLWNFGVAMMKSWAFDSTYAVFGHTSQIDAANTSYALLQGATGYTYLNAAAGANLSLRIGNADKLVVLSGGVVRVGAGTGQTLSAGSLDVGADIGINSAGNGIVVGGSRIMAFSGAFVGVGTNGITNSTRLFVESNASTRVLGLKRSDVADWWYIGVGGDYMGFFGPSSDTARWVFKNTGNVGFATLNVSAWHSAYRAIQGPRSSVMFRSDNLDNNIDLLSDAVFTDTGFVYRTSSAYAARLTMQTGQFYFQVAPTGTAGSTINFVTALKIDTQGRLILGSSTQHIVSSVDNSGILFSGGTGSASGANLILYGPNAFGVENFTVFRSGSAYLARVNPSEFAPWYDNSLNLGADSRRWSNLYTVYAWIAQAKFGVDAWHNSYSDGVNRLYFGNNSHTYIKSGGSIVFRTPADGNIAYFNSDGTTTFYGAMTISQANVTAAKFIKASHRKYKDQIEDWELDREALMMLRPRKWRYSGEMGRMKGECGYGFVTDEVARFFHTPDMLGMDDSAVLTQLVAGWQDHETRVERLERELAETQRELAALKEAA